ncbi:MAG: hypothetical protein ACK2T7_02530 [Anaerolineales bacterium]
MPRTNLGKWSVGLILAMFLLLYIGMNLTMGMYESVKAGATIWADIAQRPALSLSMLAGFGAGTAAFITGLVAIIKQKERTLLVYISTLVGAGMVLFLIAEVVFPH